MILTVHTVESFSVGTPVLLDRWIDFVPLQNRTIDRNELHEKHMYLDVDW